jgi:hypothetical protein
MMVKSQALMSVPVCLHGPVCGAAGKELERSSNPIMNGTPVFGKNL